MISATRFSGSRSWRASVREVGALRPASEERATELAQRITGEAPEGSQVRVGTAGAPHPVFLYLESHKPGIVRDLGL